ncbi:MAG: DUF4279 domain-containing protein [Saprospiraceae bacterium]|nr:DUF4279 domain-containing protein [Candidatus Defluviibacterium haderslevense]
MEIENGLPRVARIDHDFCENIVAVYFPIKGERFFLVINLTKEPNLDVDFIYTENAHRVYLTATSKTKSFQELASYLQIEPLKGWSIGERENFRGKDHDHSRIIYEPIENEAYGLDEKLELLLFDLEKDSKGIIGLSKNSYAYISVCKYQYISGNAGVGFGIEIIDRLYKLNLGIDIDIYIVGKSLKCDDSN